MSEGTEVFEIKIDGDDDQSSQHKKTEVKFEACEKGTEKAQIDKKNRIFVGGIRIDLSQGNFHYFNLKQMISKIILANSEKS